MELILNGCLIIVIIVIFFIILYCTCLVTVDTLNSRSIITRCALYLNTGSEQLLNI